jgi:hypothetical protein
MANRRMFSIDVIGSDQFIAMPASSQALYFHIGIHAQNKGVVRNIKSISRMLGCTDSDIFNLHANGFIMVSDDGYKITHWYENNGIGETAKNRNNYEYRQWRMKVLERDRYCQLCGAAENLVAHHIKSFSKHRELRTEVSNGITLCDGCHKELHRKERLHGRSQMD